MGRLDGASQVNFPFLGRVVVVVGVVVVLTTTACASDTRRSEPVPSSFAFSGIAPPTPNPLLEYSQNSTVMVALARAETILTQKCMKRFGYDYKPVMNFEKYAESFVVDNARLYGITDPVVAKVYGYLPAPSDVGLPDANAALTSANFDLVLSGWKEGEPPSLESLSKSPGSSGGIEIPAGGCLGDARLKLTGDVMGNPSSSASLGQDLRVQTWQSAMEDAEVVAAKKAWAACMAKDGYRVVDPFDGPERLSGQGEDGSIHPASEAEVKQALANIECKKKTGWVKIANAVHVRYAQRAIEENQLALQESKKFFDNALKNANDVIAQG